MAEPFPRSNDSSPGMRSLIQGSIKLPRATSNADTWKYFICVREPARNLRSWVKLSVGYICGLLGLYAVGLTITSSLLGNGRAKLVTEFEIGTVTFMGAVTAVGASVSTDALVPEILWAIKWSLLRSGRVSLQEARNILNGDQGIQAFLNILWGSTAGRLLTVIFLLAKLGPPIGFAMLWGAYQYECDEVDKHYPWSFQVRTSWALLGGGMGLAIGSTIFTGVVVGCCFRQGDIPPRSVLALARSMLNITRLTGENATITTGKEVMKELCRTREVSLQRIILKEQTIIQFAESSESSNTIRSESNTRKDRKSFVLSHCSKLAIPTIASFFAALALTIWMLSFNTRHASGGNICLAEEDSDYFAGSVSAKTGLSILTVLYSITLSACFDHTMNIYRWSVLYCNSLSIVKLESIFQGHSLWAYWHFRGVSNLGGRALSTGLLSTLIVRLLVGVIPPLALLKGWDSAIRAHSYHSAVLSLIWISFFVTLLAGLLAVVSARSYYVPADDVMEISLFLRDLVSKVGVDEVRWNELTARMIFPRGMNEKLGDPRISFRENAAVTDLAA